MARVAWRLTNPSNGAFYDFQVNPSEEQEFGKSRSIEHSAPTSGLGLVRQQGDPSPLVLKASGTILHEAQLTALAGWFQLSEDQTIYLRDHALDSYEGLLTVFRPMRKRTLRNPRDFANAPLWYWSYNLEFEVVRILSGPWVGVTP